MADTQHDMNTTNPVPEELLAGYPDNLIINRPDLKTLILKIGENLLTLAFWLFWLYLWLPFISALAWVFGFRLLYRHMVELGGFEGFLQQVNIFTAGVMFMSGSLALWSFYNMKRYGSYNRRNKVLRTDLEKLGARYALSVSRVREIQKSKKVCFSFDGNNTITRIETDEECRSE